MHSLLYYIKKYPVSLLVIGVVLYLSFFKPPHIEPPRIPYWDKIIHFCMYAGMSVILWIEFLRNHRDGSLNMLHAVIGAMVLPIIFSGLVEIFQERLTTYRGGDWLDFVANVCGILIAGIFAWFVLKPAILGKEGKE